MNKYSSVANFKQLKIFLTLSLLLHHTTASILQINNNKDTEQPGNTNIKQLNLKLGEREVPIQIALDLSTDEGKQMFNDFLKFESLNVEEMENKVKEVKKKKEDFYKFMAEKFAEEGQINEKQSENSKIARRERKLYSEKAIRSLILYFKRKRTLKLKREEFVHIIETYLNILHHKPLKINGELNKHPLAKKTLKHSVISTKTISSNTVSPNNSLPSTISPSQLLYQLGMSLLPSNLPKPPTSLKQRHKLTHLKIKRKKLIKLNIKRKRQKIIPTSPYHIYNNFSNTNSFNHYKRSKPTKPSNTGIQDECPILKDTITPLTVFKKRSVKAEKDFIREIDITDNQIQELLNVTIGVRKDPYQVNNYLNKIKVFNVGEGNGVVVETVLRKGMNFKPSNWKDTFQDNIEIKIDKGKKVHWMIGAGSTGNPQQLINGKLNAAGSSVADVADSIDEHFCPKGFELGVVFMSNTNKNNHNLVMSVLMRCSIRFFKELAVKKPSQLRIILKKIEKVDKNIIIKMDDSFLVQKRKSIARKKQEAINKISSWGSYNDEFGTKTTFMSYFNSIWDENTGERVNKPDPSSVQLKNFQEKLEKQRIALWLELNKYFADHHILWIMPTGYKPSSLTMVSGLSKEMDKLFGRKKVQVINNRGQTEEKEICLACLTISSGKGYNASYYSFARNRISIKKINKAFLNKQRDIQILGNPEFRDSRGGIEMVSPSKNSLMIELRARTDGSQRRFESVVILGDAWLDTFMNYYLINNERDGDRRVGTVIASNHGSTTRGSCGILMYYNTDRIIFSAGKNGKFKHPREDCVKSAKRLVENKPKALYDLLYQNFEPLSPKKEKRSLYYYRDRNVVVENGESNVFMTAASNYFFHRKIKFISV